MITAAKNELHLSPAATPRDPTMMRLPSGEQQEDDDRPSLPSRISAVKNHIKRLGPGTAASVSGISSNGLEEDEEAMDDDDDDEWEEGEDVEEAMEMEEERRMATKKRRRRVRLMCVYILCLSMP
jgi:hypothetical protein